MKKKMEHYVMEMDWKGKKDKQVDSITGDVMVEDYMREKGFKRVKNSAILFRKGKRVRYVTYGNMDVEDIKPKLYDYYKTFEI